MSPDPFQEFDDAMKAQQMPYALFVLRSDEDARAYIDLTKWNPNNGRSKKAELLALIQGLPDDI